MKTILFLINGFGIENKDSYSIYNNKIMPNFDNLKNKFLFQKLKSNATNYRDAYRNISLDINEKYTYSIVNNSINSKILENNEKVLNIKNKLEEQICKLQLFVFIDNSPLIVDNLKQFLSIINPQDNKKIYLHLVLNSKDKKDYPQILQIIIRITNELSYLATIGMTLGVENILDDNKTMDLTFFVKLMISEVGERWQSLQNKLEANNEIIKEPSLIKPFVSNNGYNLEKNDIMLFFNYDNINLNNFIMAVKKNQYDKIDNNISFYSLFPLNSQENIPSILDYEISKESLASNSEILNFKSLILADKMHINNINYYLNGLNNVSNTQINYVDINSIMYNSKELINIINNYNYELIVLNYNIDDVKTIEELHNKLQNIDNMIEIISNNCLTNNYSMIISSLYGINTKLSDKDGIVHTINYFGEVPIIYINKEYDKKNYLIKKGNINDLMKISYKTINNSYNNCFVINKKNLFQRIFFQ